MADRPSTPRRTPAIIAAGVYLNFTETLTKVIANAQHEARRLNQDFIGTEHLALALLDQGFHLGGRIESTRDEWHDRSGRSSTRTS